MSLSTPEWFCDWVLHGHWWRLEHLIMHCVTKWGRTVICKMPIHVQDGLMCCCQWLNGRCVIELSEVREVKCMVRRLKAWQIDLVRLSKGQCDLLHGAPVHTTAAAALEREALCLTPTSNCLQLQNSIDCYPESQRSDHTSWGEMEGARQGGGGGMQMSNEPGRGVNDHSSETHVSPGEAILCIGLPNR